MDIMEPNQNTLVPSPSEDFLSPEDIAWADSCLANDVGALDFWSNLTDALNETMISNPDPPPSRWENISPEGTVFSTSGFMDTGFMDTGDISWISSPEIAPSRWGDVPSVVRELSTPPQIMDATVDGIFSSLPEEVSEVIPEEAGLIPGSKFNFKNVFQPSYTEDYKGGGSTSIYGQVEKEESFKDIFKVWNLETQVEEDDLMKQFKKAFSGSMVPYESESESVDDVIRNMGDLSLNRMA